ncbi:hypothetical protein IFM89_037491 [Coptis chinensis]|uniref:Uncharacterized protein n=1 Tax=Coptis chinensis TaxID=261450 RepID=A0A835I8Q4_9MAGN|nr:hypothetical protein IFM89_037491 [Coptis chinensis]
MNLHFSSTYATSRRRCYAPLRDAESPVYLLFFTTSGAVPDLIRPRGTANGGKPVVKKIDSKNAGDISPLA